MQEFKGLHYIKRGEGEPVLLLHGWGTDHTSFTRVIEMLTLSNTVYAVDFWGFGKSRPPNPSSTLFDYANVIKEFISCVIGLPTAIIGHSFGGRICLIIAEHPLVEWVILIDSAGLPSHGNLVKTIKQKRYKRLKEKVAKNQLPPDVIKNWGSADYRATPDNLKRIFVDTVNTDLTNYAKRITKPTLILFGKKDKTTPPYMAKKLHKLINNSTLKIIKGGHFVFIDNFRESMNIIANFLNQYRGERHV